MKPLEICAIVKDEELYISEWIAYHASIGVSSFKIYLNNSSDKTEQILRTCQHSNLITIVEWPHIPGQLSAYQHHLDAVATPSWIAFIDVDEFLYSRDMGSIVAFLNDLPDSVTCVYVNWLIFGSSSNVSKSFNGVLETFTMRAYDDFNANKIGKCIVRSDGNGSAQNPHYIATSGLDCNGAGVIVPKNRSLDFAMVKPVFERLVINHYFTKSREEWDLKKSRGRVDLPLEHQDYIRSDEQFIYHDRNDVKDTRILDYLDLHRLDKACQQ